MEKWNSRLVFYRLLSEMKIARDYERMPKGALPVAVFDKTRLLIIYPDDKIYVLNHYLAERLKFVDETDDLDNERLTVICGEDIETTSITALKSYLKMINRYKE